MDFTFVPVLYVNIILGILPVVGKKTLMVSTIVSKCLYFIRKVDSTWTNSEANKPWNVENFNQRNYCDCFFLWGFDLSHFDAEFRNPKNRTHLELDSFPDKIENFKNPKLFM